MAPSKKSDVKPSEGTSSSLKVTRNMRKRKIIKRSTRKKKKNSGISCAGCSKSFETASKLRLHKLKCKEFQDLDPIAGSIRNKVALLRCQQCPKKFKFEKRLLEHIVQEHSEAPNSVQCDQCGVRCPDKTTLIEHINSFHDRSLYECPYCKKTFVRAYHVQRHLKQKGCDGDTVTTISCEICNTTFKRKDNLLVHLRSHLTLKDYHCKHCSYMSQSFSRYSSHVMKKHMPKRFECDHCGKVNSSRAAIAKHLEIHGEKKYACEVCGYSTHTIEVIRRHVLRHTTDKPYKCELCPASFIQILQLRRHLEKHVGNRCNICRKSFKTKARWTAHQRTHMGLKELTCPYEGCVLAKKLFPSEVSLQDHLNMHEQKTFSCEVCAKRFHNQLNLRRHMSTHTLDRPRRCMYCVSARAYIRGEMLVRHVRVRHPAIFHEHLMHVRQVMGYDYVEERVKKTETESILNLLDAITDRILDQNKDGNVLYGGMQETDTSKEIKSVKKEDSKPALLSEPELEESLRKLMTQLIDAKTLEEFGWPGESVDVVLEKVLEQCGTRPADRTRWSRVQCLRENAKHLFLHVIEDETTSRMLETHTIDQVVTHILEVSESQDDDSNQEGSQEDEQDQHEEDDNEQETTSGHKQEKYVDKSEEDVEDEEKEEEMLEDAEGVVDDDEEVVTDGGEIVEDEDETVENEAVTIEFEDAIQTGGDFQTEAVTEVGTNIADIEEYHVEIAGEDLELEVEDKKLILLD